MQISFCAIVLLIPYLLLIIIFILGWFRIKSPSVDAPTVYSTFVTVLVPLKNEASNISRLVEEFRNQDYPKEYLEIMLIDDHSSDGSAEIIYQSVCQDIIFKIINLPEGESGKKAAIKNGLRVAKGDLIITTDADCYFSPVWISEMVKYYKLFPSHLLIGPVFMKEEGGFFNHFQNLEFLSLIASTAGAAGIGRPIMCNGANLGGDKSLFQKASSIYNSSIASGDDIFLLLELKRLDVPSVFVNSNEAAIITANQKSVDGFIKQRSRWTFKSRFYKDLDIIITAVIVLMTNLMMLAGLILVIFFPAYIVNFLVVYLLKCLVDYVLLYYVAEFFGRKQLLRYFLVHQLLYIIYVSVIGTLGHLRKTKWKT